MFQRPPNREAMVVECFKGRGIGSRSVKVLALAVGFFFGNTELSLELWNIIAGISGFDD